MVLDPVGLGSMVRQNIMAVEACDSGYSACGRQETEKEKDQV
jgi:hypothetical protein